jgi:hypothetical protein
VLLLMQKAFPDLSGQIEKGFNDEIYIE